MTDSGWVPLDPTEHNAKGYWPHEEKTLSRIFWYYSHDTVLDGRTLMLRHVALKIDIPPWKAGDILSSVQYYIDNDKLVMCDEEDNSKTVVMRLMAKFEDCDQKDDGPNKKILDPEKRKVVEKLKEKYQEEQREKEWLMRIELDEEREKYISSKALAKYRSEYKNKKRKSDDC